MLSQGLQFLYRPTLYSDTAQDYSPSDSERESPKQDKGGAGYTPNVGGGIFQGMYMYLFLIVCCLPGPHFPSSVVLSLFHTTKKKKNIPCEMFSMFAKYYKMSFVWKDSTVLHTVLHSLRNFRKHWEILS